MSFDSRWLWFDDEIEFWSFDIDFRRDIVVNGATGGDGNGDFLIDVPTVDDDKSIPTVR